jgi:hypothetical protein
MRIPPADRILQLSLWCEQTGLCVAGSCCMSVNFSTIASALPNADVHRELSILEFQGSFFATSKILP